MTVHQKALNVDHTLFDSDLRFDRGEGGRLHVIRAQAGNLEQSRHLAHQIHTFEFAVLHRDVSRPCQRLSQIRHGKATALQGKIPSGGAAHTQCIGSDRLEHRPQLNPRHRDSAVERRRSDAGRHAPLCLHLSIEELKREVVQMNLLPLHLGLDPEVLHFDRFLERQGHREVPRVHDRRTDVDRAVPSSRASADGERALPQRQLQIDHVDVRRLFQRAERAVQCDRQVERLDKRREMEAGCLTESNRLEEKLQILQHVFDGLAGREIPIRQLPAADRDPIERQHGQNPERTFRRRQRRARRSFRRGHPLPAQSGHIQDAPFILDHGDDRIHELDVPDLDLSGQQRHQLHAHAHGGQRRERVLAEGRVVHDHKPGHTGAESRPQRELNILDGDLAIERLLHGRPVLLLVLIQIDEEGQRERKSKQEEEDGTDPDQDFHHGVSRLNAKYRESVSEGQCVAGGVDKC